MKYLIKTTDNSALDTVDYTRVIWDTTDDNVLIQNTIGGLGFYKKNDHSVYMFVPAAGNAGGGSINYVGEHGNLWSSSINLKNVQYARHFLSNADYCGASYCARFSGLPLRGVLTQ